MPDGESEHLTRRRDFLRTLSATAAASGLAFEPTARAAEEQPVQAEPFFDTDPAEMTAVVRQVDQPCLGFKILAAGRSCWQPKSVENCFPFAFENLKPIDGVIVGMFPAYRDEVADNAAHTRKYAAV